MRRLLRSYRLAIGGMSVGLLIWLLVAGQASVVATHGRGSTETVIGEAGTRGSMDNDEWNSVSLTESYGSTPHVFATTQTTNGGQDPSEAHVDSVTTTGFWTQHCEWDLPDTCDNHATEKNGWVAIDPGDVNGIDGMETGTLTVSGTSGALGDEYSVSFSSSFSTTPLVFAQVQTENGGDEPLNVQVVDRSTTGFTLEFCEQETEDACDGHTSEDVAWWAIDPSQVGEEAGFEYGTVSSSDSLWNSISFEQSFSTAPAVIATVQTENGGQEALYPEVDSVSTSGASVRYCESDGGDSCDGHATETVAWLALEPGAVDLSDGGTLVVRDDDGEKDTSAQLDYSDDHAVKRLELGSTALDDATSATLHVYGTVDSCGASGDSHWLEANGNPVLDFNVCNRWSTTGYSWETFSIPLADLSAGTTNDFQIEDAYTEWADRDLHVGVDQDNDFGRSDITANGNDIAGELMWYLEITKTSGGMSEDFDDGTADGWSLFGLWHVSDVCETPPSTPNYLGYNLDSTCDYDIADRTSGSARFSVDLSGASSATWTFDHKWETESTSSTAYDVMRVEASTDGGSTWDTLQQWDSTDANQASWGSESFSLDGYTGGTVDLRFFFDSKDSVANTYLGWLVDNVEVTTSDGGGGGGNSAPTADFTYGCTNLDCSFTDQSSDSDGSIASWSWDFGDGATSSQQHPTHTYDCGGVYTVTLTVTDDDGATGSTSRDVTVSDADSDGDGLSNCVEEQGGLNACSQSWDPTDPTDPDTDFDGLDDGAEVNTHCTVPNDPDTDDDEFEDGPEVNNFGKPSIFCGSSCAYPDPFTPDLYLEVDFWEHDDALGNPERHTMSNSVRSDLEAIFSNQGIDAHIDNGQLGGGGTVIEGDFEVSWSFLRNNVYRNTNYFDSDRQGIFHQMIYVHDLTLDGARVCGVGGSGYEFSAVAHGEIYDGFYDLPQCHTDNDAAVRIVTAQELGHNDFSTIEPSEDHCGGDGGTAHDNKEGYSMATPYCGGWADWDYHGNRWTEHKGYVADGIDDSECTEQSFNDGDPMTCPSPGDLNRGVR